MESAIDPNQPANYKHGRTFHGVAGNPYPMPNDQEEHARLDEQSDFYRAAHGGNIFAPINREETKTVLDVGAGSGRWAIQVAEELPAAHVIGMDISPIRPTHVPPNCEFKIGNLTKDLDTFEKGSMDLVSSRLVLWGVKKNQWSKYVNDIFRILKPGNGWAQFSEPIFRIEDDGSVPEDSYYAKQQLLRERAEHLGIIRGGDHIEQRFKDAGFIDIKVTKQNNYFGNWVGDKPPKGDIWDHGYKIFLKTIEPLSATLVEAFPDEEERREFGQKVYGEVKTNAYHIYSTMTTVIGRKPADAA